MLRAPGTRSFSDPSISDPSFSPPSQLGAPKAVVPRRTGALALGLSAAAENLAPPQRSGFRFATRLRRGLRNAVLGVVLGATLFGGTPLAAQASMTGANPPTTLTVAADSIAPRPVATVELSSVTETKSDRERIQDATVSAARAFAGAELRFGALQANPKFWNVAYHEMTLVDGASPTEALRDILTNPDQYQFECASAIGVIKHLAALELVGDADFDRAFTELSIDQTWRWAHRSPIAGHLSHAARGVLHERGDKLVEGNRYYFANPSVRAEHAESWQGENVIYLGDGQFFGHGLGIGDRDFMLDALSERADPAGEAPYLTGGGGLVKTILLLDTTAN